MRLLARFLAVPLVATVAPLAFAAEEEKEEEEVPIAVVHLLATTNQGGLQKILMQSMEACQAAANGIYEKGDDYSGPTLHIYCVADDGTVWAFDRWNRED